MISHCIDRLPFDKPCRSFKSACETMALSTKSGPDWLLLIIILGLMAGVPFDVAVPILPVTQRIAAGSFDLPGVIARLWQVMVSLVMFIAAYAALRVAGL